MSLSQAESLLKEVHGRAALSGVRPPACLRCGSGRVTWKEWRTRTASALVAGAVVFFSDVATRRAQCRDCRRGFTVQPVGLLARKHYQPCVVAQAVADYLFEPEASQQAIAQRYGCSRRQVGRWVVWVGRLVSPGALQAQLVVVSDAPLTPPPVAVADLERKARTPARRALLALAALVLVLLERLGAALGLEPPGLRGVLLALSRGVRALAPYSAPALPDLARRQVPGGFGSLAM